MIKRIIDRIYDIIYKKVLRLFYKKSFLFWQKLGFYITPNHFYYPIPDTTTLKDDLWIKPSELTGIDINEEGQINLLSRFSSEFKEEYEKLPRNKTSTPYQYYVRMTFLVSQN